MRWSFAALLIAGAAATAYHFTRQDPERQRAATRSGTGGDDPGELAVDRPRPAPGADLTIALINKPATHYGRASSPDPLREISVRVAGGRGHHDATLAAAAREVAFHSAVIGTSPPESVSTFLLHSSGAPETSVARFVLHTNDEGDDVIERAIDEALSQVAAGQGALFFGAGEADTPGERHSRRIVVLTARRTFELDSAPRFAGLNDRWTMRGRLPVGFRDAVAMALYPDGKLEQVDIETRGSAFEVAMPTGAIRGAIEVGIDGTGPGGPGKLLQLTVDVGRALPRQMSLEIPEGDPDFDSIEDAEAYAASLLARDRAAFGAPVLAVDPELSAIARGHSEEMRDLRYFGHQSPRTGLAGDRLRAARYRTSMSGENLAKNDSLTEAEASLLASVGHRANLLSRGFTHVGLGVAKATERGQTQWYVTQLFAKKAETIDASAALATILDTIDAARDGANARPLELSDVLGEVASEAAAKAAEATGDRLAERVGKEARDRSQRTVAVSIQVIYDLGQLQVSASLLDPDMTRLGAAVYQPPDDLSGKIAVVLIAAR